MIYIALLRGVNVGGNNKINMTKLAQSFVSVGCKEVSTYINSGNIVFISDNEDKNKLSNILEQIILKDFEIEIKVLLIDQTNFDRILAHIPLKWQNDDIQKTDIMYLWDELDKPSIVDDLKVNIDIEDLRYVPGALLYNIKRENVDTSRLNKIAGTRIYKYMTVRNINTVRRIAEIVNSVDDIIAD
jgi:uncharacterized protein (DUF1697 family)